MSHPLPFSLTTNSNLIILSSGDTTITALPFQAAFNDIALTLSAAFTPKLLMGISVFDGDGTAGAGAFLSLPSVSATVAQVANVNSKCEPEAVSSNNNDTSALDGALEDIFGSLTHLTSEVDLAVGAVGEAKIQAGNFGLGDSVSHTFWSTGFPLPTACFSFDAAAKTFGSPASTASATGKPKASAGAASGDSSSAASLGRENPLGGVLGRWGRFETTLAILATVSSGFVRM